MEGQVLGRSLCQNSFSKASKLDTLKQTRLKWKCVNHIFWFFLYE